MKYTAYLATVLQDTYCPFCQLGKSETVEEGEYFRVIPARAPYSKDHLLIIPKRHVVFLKELKNAEKKELWELAEKRDRILQQDHEGSSILLRDAFVDGKVGKSINHLHLHIIPDCPIGTGNGEHRSFFSDGKYLKTVKELKKRYLD